MVKHTKEERRKSGKHVRIYAWEFHSDAFKALSPNAIKVYLDIKFRYNGCNNGAIAYSSREAGLALNKSNNTGARALDELILFGFLRIHKDSSFGQKRLAREYEITAINLQPTRKSHTLPSGNRDFLRLTPLQIGKLKGQKQSTKNNKLPLKEKDSFKNDEDSIKPTINITENSTKTVLH